MANYIDDAGAARIPEPAPGPGPEIGDDADRDRRIGAYRDRQRRRAVRALDRYIAAVFDDPAQPHVCSTVATAAGDRFVEAVGDYVLSRLQHNSHYGAPVDTEDATVLPSGLTHNEGVHDD